jgi:hypothetical protein
VLARGQRCARDPSAAPRQAGCGAAPAAQQAALDLRCHSFAKDVLQRTQRIEVGLVRAPGIP